MKYPLNGCSNVTKLQKTKYLGITMFRNNFYIYIEIYNFWIQNGWNQANIFGI